MPHGARCDKHTVVHPSKTGQQLEKLSVAILDVLNTRNFSDPVLAHLSPLYQSSFGTKIISNDLASFMRNIDTVLAHNPDYHHLILNTSSEVDEEKGRASVWVSHKGTGFPPDEFERESVKVMKWERCSGRWMCMGHSGLVGNAMLP
ncbi:hypothetical protein LTR56_023386 [Elasticomyces elasticus]|uniref:SnoaL-like domain-containing protein n=1 Tax=Elasticomyces elasticus TaxID=574655 RepID=A0AAN7W7A3_9PEZI|nr:hypothetical protein LTR56_023386 [Elasticomyces elasticus]KAK3635084.1 hypothetical protein LTR22_019365 [Elasticomyces elasticus]KAK4906761.1 hypothetical protein LTR49_024133 [Elasticomyces elasticus]KAK5699869.1 hypothetical protein LTR97_006002 [Elasticomyces elasticus]KAK5769310.1 hypothetical protein LTS12_000662 [Elasticomyces elasticus]